MSEECWLIRCWGKLLGHSWHHASANAQRAHCYRERTIREEVKQESSVTQLGFFSASLHKLTLKGCLTFSPLPYRPYLAYSSGFFLLQLVAKALPGAIYQNNLLSKGNLLLTDKSLPSLGCNESLLSSFSKYCPGRPPPRQTQHHVSLLFSLKSLYTNVLVLKWIQTKWGMRRYSIEKSLLLGFISLDKHYCWDGSNTTAYLHPLEWCYMEPLINSWHQAAHIISQGL